MKLHQGLLDKDTRCVAVSVERPNWLHEGVAASHLCMRTSDAWVGGLNHGMQTIV